MTYAEKKKLEMAEAMQTIHAIKSSKNKWVSYRDMRPVTDLKHMIETSALLFAERPAFLGKKTHKDPYETITYLEFMDDINALGTGLISLGLKDKRIGIIGPNSYRWALSYMAVVCGTGVVVPLDKELPVENLKEQLADAEVSAVILDKKYRDLFLEIKQSGETKLEILIDKTAGEDDENFLSLSKIKEKGAALVSEGDTSFTKAEIDNKAMSILLYTSGTTGASKGIMLSHRNIAEDLMVSPTVLRVTPEDRFFSVLPLHHTYECTSGFLMPMYSGASIAYCEGLKYILTNMQESQPTFFLGVPAIFEMIYKKIRMNVRKSGKEKKLDRAIKLNKFTKKFKIDNGDKFFKDIKDLFGGKLRMMISGGAAISPEVLDFFNDIGIMALQGYGLTECAPMGALNPDIAPNSKSIGVAFPNCDAMIYQPNENGIGEICLGGANVMIGYYKRPDLTEEAIIDGWFHTGDLGYIDADGYIYMSGRKKNVIITKNGKNVYPEELEFYLSEIPLVAESMVFERAGQVGDDNVIAATIVVDEEYIKDHYASDPEDSVLEAELWEEVDKINERNPLFKQIKVIQVRRKPLIKNSSNKVVRFREENSF